MSEVQNRIEIIIGRKGEGKSSLAFHRAGLARRGVAIFSPGYNLNAPWYGKGRAVYSSVQLAQAMAPDSAERLVIFVPESDDVEGGFEEFSQVVLERRGIAVIVDEVALLGSAQHVEKSLKAFIIDSRKKEIDVFLTGHRPQDFHGNIYSQADVYVFFSTTLRRDLDAIEHETNEELREQVRQLGSHHFACWDMRSQSFFVNKKPETWKPHAAARASGNLIEMEV